MTIGVLSCVWAVYPIISYEVFARVGDRVSLKPVSDTNQHYTRAVSGSSKALSQNVSEFIQVHDWFPTRPQTSLGKTSHVKEYWITIPKLNILNARVEVGGEDLSRSLVHYLPTTMPGEYGSVNIFGHSTLPQLYNAKDYKTIFTFLPNIQQGDSVLVTFDGQQFEYEVYDVFVVKPDQVSVLEPQHDASYLTLITCVPPGTYWNRLVVRARLKYLPFQRMTMLRARNVY
jgi:sortase A